MPYLRAALAGVPKSCRLVRGDQPRARLAGRSEPGLVGKRMKRRFRPSEGPSSQHSEVCPPVLLRIRNVSPRVTSHWSWRVRKAKWVPQLFWLASLAGDSCTKCERLHVKRKSNIKTNVQVVAAQNCQTVKLHKNKSTRLTNHEMRSHVKPGLPPTFWPKLLTSGGVSDDAAAGNSGYRTSEL